MPRSAAPSGRFPLPRARDRHRRRSPPHPGNLPRRSRHSPKVAPAAAPPPARVPALRRACADRLVAVNSLPIALLRVSPFERLPRLFLRSIRPVLAIRALDHASYRLFPVGAALGQSTAEVERPILERVRKTQLHFRR